MASSPPRRPLGTIPTNQTIPPSPKRPTVPAEPSATPNSAVSTGINRYRPTRPVPYSPPSAIKRLMTNVSKFRWGVNELRERQRYSLSFIFHNKASGGTALIVDRTGGGKSHTMRCSGVFTRGITVVIVPLLALAADVFLKFVNNDERYGSVQAIHFDEDIGDDKPLRQQLIADIKEAAENMTDETLFIFISPQRLNQYKDIRSCLLSSHHKGDLRNVMIDEFHLFCQHGMDFRAEIREICNSFIRVLMKRNNSPYLILCTTTCSLHNIDTFRRMTGVDLKSHQYVWSPPSTFQQRNISMTFEITKKYKQATSSFLLDFLQHTNITASFIVYTGTAVLAKDIYHHLRDSLNKSNIPLDVLLVHGSQSSLEKFHYTRVFTSQSNELIQSGINLRGFVGTSAIDAGLDHPNLACEVICQTPRDLHSYIQRRGRVGRSGEPATCHLCINFDDFMYIAGQVLVDHHVQPHNKHLQVREREIVARVKFDELMTFIRLVALQNGCWHCKIESFCSRGYLPMGPIPSGSPHFPPCKNQCPECTGKIKKYFRPFSISGLIHFLDSNLSSRSFPIRFVKLPCQDLVELVWTNKVAMKLIYDRVAGTVKRFNVEALMLQLFAVGVLQFSNVTKVGSGMIVLAREKQSIQHMSVERYKRRGVYTPLITLDDSKDRQYPFLDVLQNGSYSLN